VDECVVKLDQQIDCCSGVQTIARFCSRHQTFDSGLQKAGFTGKIATEVADAVKLNSQLITDLTSIKSVASFQAELEPLFSKYSPVQDALAKDFGIPAGDVVI